MPLEATLGGGWPVPPLSLMLGMADIKDLQNMVQEIRQTMGTFRLSRPLESELLGDLKTLEFQMASSKPDLHLVRHSLIPIRYILETIPTNNTAVRLIAHISKFLIKHA